MLEGALDRMAVAPGSPARYALAARAAQQPPAMLDLHEVIGGGLRLEFRGRISCTHCGADTPKSYGGGYCYRCFTTLARCDLCVVSPARCHYAAGTCREPEWGETFCMRPHLVYLANSSGPKVGITGRGGEITRWLDQGASQGLIVAEAATRQLAGVLEARLSREVSDRTDWRALLRGDAEPVDLRGLRDRLVGRVGPPGDGVSWRRDEMPVDLSYPILDYPARLARLSLDDHPRVAGRLLGVKGQYLLFEHGVLNVRRHRGYHVRASVAALAFAAEPAGHQDSQMELFS